MQTKDIPPALILSEEEVDKLLSDKAEVRIGVTDKLAGAYTRHNLTEQELKAVEQIFRLLVRDTELRVRMSLANHLKDSDQIPRDIVMTMARDVAEVALPVLQFSEVLTDDDLVALVQAAQEPEKILAVSRRKEVSEAVAEKLIEKGNEEVAASLVENKGAQISSAGIERLVEKHRGNPRLMQAVSQRPRLPAATAEKLVHVVSTKLAENLKEKYKLPAEKIEKEVEKTRESETLHLIRNARSQSEIDLLVNQLHGFQRLTPSLILSALCQGNFAFFETSLARMSNIPVANARALITDRGELGFRAIYNKSGLPDAMFPAVKLLLKVARELDTEGERPGNARYANRIVERLLQYAEGENIENLSYIIALVRRSGQ